MHRTEMNNEFRELETGLANIDQELKEHYDENTHSEDDRFLPVMRDFHTQASTEFKRLYLLRNKMGEWYDKVVRYYGEDPTKMHPDEFFGIFKKFTSSWEVTTRRIFWPLVFEFSQTGNNTALHSRCQIGAPKSRTTRKAKEARTRTQDACP